jgi:drug/metabolite transporter (DMT)-like permease
MHITNKTTKFANAKYLLLALLVMALWGSLYPMVKIGYKTLGIVGGDTANILTYTGIRFLVCGMVASGLAVVKKDKFPALKSKSFAGILLIALFSIFLNYAFANVGLSFTDGSKAAIIKQLGGLVYVCVAFLFFKDEKFSVWKIVGAAVGFAGIIAINFNGEGISFSIGDILIISSSVSTVAGNIFNKKVAEGNSPFWITGISQIAGGAVLIIAGVILGADMLVFNLASLGIFAYLCVASIIAYLLWSYILKTADLSNIFIIKFAEPLFACIFSAVLLRENILRWQYFVAFVLVSVGITLGNLKKKEPLQAPASEEVEGKTA